MLKWNSLAAMSKRVITEQRAQNFAKRTPGSLLSIGVDRSCFGEVLQTVDQGTFHR